MFVIKRPMFHSLLSLYAAKRYTVLSPPVDFVSGLHKAAASEHYFYANESCVQPSPLVG